MPGPIAIAIPQPRLRPGGGGGAPAFPPNVSGTQATIAADFAGNQYWASAATQASFAAWLTAIGGTYTRSSSATYLQAGVVKTATANTPRFTTNLAGTGKGIRLTGAATNIQLQSQFASGWAGQNGTLTLNNATGPDGVANSAGTAIPNTGTTNHGILYTAGINYTANTYTHSIFAKAAGYNFFVLDATNGGAAANNYAVFDLTTGAVTSQGSNVTRAGSIVLANGWWLCWVTVPMTAGNINNMFSPLPTSTYAAYAGDGVSGAQFFGAQETQTSFPCDYIPTTTATVTQAADLFQFPFTQTTFSVLAGTANQQTVNGGTIVGAGSTQPLGITTAPTFTIWTGANFLTGPTLGSGLASSHRSMAAGSPSSSFITSDGLVPVTGAFALQNVAPVSMFLGVASGNPNSYGDISQFAVWNGIVASTAEMQRLTT